MCKKDPATAKRYFEHKSKQGKKEKKKKFKSLWCITLQCCLYRHCHPFPQSTEPEGNKNTWSVCKRGRFKDCSDRQSNTWIGRKWRLFLFMKYNAFEGPSSLKCWKLKTILFDTYCICKVLSVFSGLVNLNEKQWIIGISWLSWNKMV